MPKMKSNNKVHTQKEIGIALNNAVQAISSSAELRKLSDSRKKQLRNYLSAILDVILEHRKKEHLTSEELVFVLSSGALFSFVWLVTKGSESKLAMYQDVAASLAQDLQND
jgi:hypothetical protein